MAEPPAPRLAAALNRLAAQGRLVVCGTVYAELYGFYPDLETLLRTYGVSADPQMPLSAWQRAGAAHAAYSVRRQVSGGGLPRRILTNFLIGAHASTFSHALLTLNTGDYGDFPEVPLLTVAQP